MYVARWILVMLSLSTMGITNASAECWRMPDGRIAVTHAGSSPPAKSVRQVACPTQQNQPSVKAIPNATIERQPPSAVKNLPAVNNSFRTETSTNAYGGPGKPTPLITACGPSSGKYRFGIRAFLQGVEVYQAVGFGVSFNAACEAHDACYGAVGSKATRRECDDQFARIADETCKAVANRKACNEQRDAFYQKIRSNGRGAFCAARGQTGNCPNSG